jgi:hypothetical protein
MQRFFLSGFQVVINNTDLLIVQPVCKTGEQVSLVLVHEVPSGGQNLPASPLPPGQLRLPSYSALVFPCSVGTHRVYRTASWIVSALLVEKRRFHQLLRNGPGKVVGEIAIFRQLRLLAFHR